jgi:cell division ATPase FtsA
VFGLPVHLTHAHAMSGLTSAFENPQLSTAIGLIKYAQAMMPERQMTGPFSTLLKKLKFF